MSTLHSMKKTITKNSFIFNPDMYHHTLGSVIVCAYMFTENKPNPVDINKKWHKICKNPKKYVDFWIDDPKFIDKSLALFDLQRPEQFPIAMVQSSFNVLFMPYLDGQLYPLREDGFMPPTANHGKIYPIDFTNIEEANDKLATK